MRGGRHTLRVALGLAVACAVPARALLASPRQKTDRDTAASSSRIHLQPRFLPGEVLRYSVELQTTSNAKPTGAIEDPEGPSQVTVTWDALIRLEVLPAPAAAALRSAPAAPVTSSASPRAVRLRTTYEESAATVNSDTPDPQADKIESQYARLRGRSLEFTLSGDGSVSQVRGLDQVLPNDAAAKAARQWMAQFSAGASVPAAGVVPGQHWSSRQPADSLPLQGLVWRTDSTYLRDEPCRPASLPRLSAGSASEPCAVIVSRLALLSPHPERDPTPKEYRRNGLQTSGTWRGTGESLAYVSLRTGWVVSVTQTATEQMDVTISRGAETAMHYAGTVTTRSSVSLVPAAAPSR